MKEQKFILLLSVFTDEERAGFSLFLESPYFKFKYRCVCNRLLKNIINRSKVKDSKKQIYDFSKLDKKELAIATFGKEVDALKSLNVYLSILCKNALTFIGINDPENRNPNIARLVFFYERNLTKLFGQYFTKYKKELFQAKQSEKTLHTKFELEKLATGQLIYVANKKVNINTNSLAVAAFNYQVLSSLKIVCDQINLSRTNISKFDHSMVEPFLDKLVEQSKVGFEEPIIELYYLAYQCFTGSVEVAVLFEKIMTYHTNIANVELMKLLKFSKNICIGGIKKGDGNAYKLFHKINKFSVKQDLFVQKEGVTVRDFNNTVHVIARMKDFEWGHEFIEKFAKYLPKEEINKNKQISQALLFFENRQFKESLDLLIDKSFDKDLYLECNRRNLVIKIYYELGKYEQAEGLIDSFVRYLRIVSKKKMPANLAKSYRLFLQELRKLIRLHYDVNLSKEQKQDRLDKLRVFAEKNNFVGKTWFLEKLSSL